MTWLCVCCNNVVTHIEHYILCYGQIEDNIKHLFDDKGLLK